MPHGFGVYQTKGVKSVMVRGTPLWNRCKYFGVKLGEMVDGRRVQSRGTPVYRTSNGVNGNEYHTV